MKVDAEAIRWTLLEEMAKGRSDVEAAGIALWGDTERERQGLISEQTRQETEEVILRWLRADADDRPSAPEFVARELADYLTANIDLGTPEPPDLVPEPPDWKVEAALQRWREERRP